MRSYKLSGCIKDKSHPLNSLGTYQCLVLYPFKLFLMVFFLGLSAPLPCQTVKGFYLENKFDEDKIVASVDSIKITAEEFYLNYEFGPAFVKRDKYSKEKHLKFMINEKLLALDGYARSVDTTEELSSVLTEFRNDIMTEELYKLKILPHVNITDSEINKVVGHKQSELEIKWLFAPGEERIKEYIRMLTSGISFDSIFSLQINDSINFDDRYMKTDCYHLESKNALLASILDTMKAGDISSPFHIDDGWYIIKLVNISQNIITSESEYQKLKQEAHDALIKRKMDFLSDEYIKELMANKNPVIKGETFALVRSYLGKHYLPVEKYSAWELDKNLDQLLENMGGDLPGSVLVNLNEDSVSIKEFLTWYRNRSQYIKLNENNITNFSASIEQLIWRMVRDRLLSEEAIKYGCHKSEEVIKQTGWWRDKIVSSAVRNEIVKSIILEHKESNADMDKARASDPEEINYEFQKKMLHKIISLEKKYRIEIKDDELESIQVSQENDPRAIEFYSVKKGGLIPRTPYPTINNEWVNWE